MSERVNSRLVDLAKLDTGTETPVNALSTSSVLTKADNAWRVLATPETPMAGILFSLIEAVSEVIRTPEDRCALTRSNNSETEDCFDRVDKRRIISFVSRAFSSGLPAKSFS